MVRYTRGMFARHTYSKSMDQPGKVANVARGHSISVCVFSSRLFWTSSSFGCTSQSLTGEGTQDFSYTFFLRCMPSFLVRSFQPFLSLVDREVDICVRFNRPPQCFSSKLFWTSSSLDVPAGVTQWEGHTRFLTHLPSAVRALIFLARRNQPFLFLVDREVEICAERA